jgi:hypothetical protein
MEARVRPIEARRDPASPLFDGDDFEDLLDEIDDDEDAGKRGIRCPRCAWTPRPGDRWMCLCLHSWNTFDTRGRCPSCGQQWLDTQCLSCGAWSPHKAWYVDEPEGGSEP